MDQCELESNVPTFKCGEKPESRFPSLLLPGELAPQESMEQLFIPAQVGEDEGISELCVRRTAAASLIFFHVSTDLSRILQATPVAPLSLC